VVIGAAQAAWPPGEDSGLVTLSSTPGAEHIGSASVGPAGTAWEGTRYALSDWLDWMGFIDAGVLARLDRFIGYYQPYATSHQELDRDEAVQEEVRNVARAVINALSELRAGRLSMPGKDLERPRPK